MKRASWLVLACLLSSFVLLTGCEDSSSNSDSGKIINNTERVVGKNQSSVYAFTLDLTGGIRLFIDGSIPVEVQRPSCSGFNIGSPNDISIGNTIEYEYIGDQVDYSTDPASVFPLSITVFNDDCISGRSSGSSTNGCNVCDRDRIEF